MASDLTQWLVAAETKEWVGPITVLADDVSVTTFQVTLTGPGERPIEWETPTALDGGLGLLVGTGTDFPLQAGRKYTVWIRFTDSPEQPVMHVGQVKAY